MTWTKKKKTVLLISISAAVAVIVAAVLLWLALGRTQRTVPFEIRRSQSADAIIYCAVKGEEAAAPYDETLFYSAQILPCYTFTPPEGWTMTQDGLAANLLNHYTDVYQTAEGAALEFSQSPATAQILASSETPAPYTNSWQLDPSTIQEVQFGDNQVIYSDDGSVTRVYWVHEQSLLSFACWQEMDINQMLELITRVDYHTLRDQPQQIDLPLSLQRGSYQEVQTGAATTVQSQPYCSTGSPALPEEPALCALPQPPAGYTLVDQDQSPGSSLLEKYQNQGGEILAFSCVAGAGDFFGKSGSAVVYLPFEGLSNQELADPSAV